jgi:sulfatase maturation enzyme AslB (radical SAM superfamily)
MGEKSLKELIEDPKNQDLIKSLCGRHIFIDKDFDEIEFFKVKLNLMRYGLKSLSLTIVPTRDCNLKCIYCYEGSRLIKYPDKGIVIDSGNHSHLYRNCSLYNNLYDNQFNFKRGEA